MSNEELVESKNGNNIPESGEAKCIVEDNKQQTIVTDFNSFLPSFVQKLESKYDIKFACYQLDESNEQIMVLSHNNVAEIIKLLRQVRSGQILKTEGNGINEDCVQFTNKMLWFVIDVLVGMNVALYRHAVMDNNNVDIEMNAITFLKQINSINEPQETDKQPNDAKKDKGSPISVVMYLARNYMNNCWHSYFKKDGTIWCIEDCVDTLMKHSGLLNVKCAFFQMWRLFTILYSTFLEKLFNDKYPVVNIKNANELRAFCMLVIGLESEESLRRHIESAWPKLKCEKECEGNEEYDGSNYFELQQH